MSEAEAKANQHLHALNEAYLIGRITREDYRARRRRVLAALSDSHGVTARQVTQRAPLAGASAPSAVGITATRRPVAWRPWLLLIGGVVVCAIVVGWLLRA